MALESYESLQRRESVRMLAGMLELCQDTNSFSPQEVGAKVFAGIKRYALSSAACGIFIVLTTPR